MTDQITIPRETWDAMREALKQIEWSNDSKWQADCAREALAAANAVSEQAQVDLPLTNEGDMPQAQGDAIIKHIEDAIKDHCSGSDLYMSALVAAGKIQALAAANAVSDHFRGVTEMVQPLGWYCVSRDGLATQCADQRDAEVTAESANRDWPNSAPYRAVQLCEFEAHPQATEPAGYDKDQIEKAVRVLVGVATFGSNSKRQDGTPTPNRLRQLESAKYLHSLVSNEEFEAEYAFTLGHFAAVEHSTEPAGWEELTSAAREVLDYTEAAHRPPVRDVLEAGRMVSVRLHALASLHDALNMLAAAPEAKQ